MSAIPPEIQKVMPSQAELEKADKEVAILFLVKGKQKGGGNFWAYLAVPPSKVVAFKEAESKGNYSLADYGEIVESGDGDAPPADIIERMKTEYGADPNFERNLTSEIQKAIDQGATTPKSKDDALMDKIDQMKKDQDNNS